MIGITDNTNYTNIADAIRDKGVNGVFKPNEMPDAIRSIETGGDGPTDEDLTYTGDINYLFANDKNNWIIKLYGRRLRFINCSRLHYVFKGNTTKDLSYLTFDSNGLELTTDEFLKMSSVEKVPLIKNAVVTSCNNLFNMSHYLREIPDDYFSTWRMKNNKYPTTTAIFFNCYSLRKIPTSFSDFMASSSERSTSYGMGFYSMYSSCYALDELTNIAFNKLYNGTSNYLNDLCTYCCRVKDITFRLDELGQPVVGLFKNNTLDLSLNSGWSSNTTGILNYNSGITADKEVTDDTTYQLLKNDPDWFTLDVRYSRYNHDSAVRTINTLPDTSATGTNIIKFKGEAGSLTDGGAINTLTPEEIAVAATKGWTVSFV